MKLNKELFSNNLINKPIQQQAFMMRKDNSRWERRIYFFVAIYYILLNLAPENFVLLASLGNTSHNIKQNSVIYIPLSNIFITYKITFGDSSLNRAYSSKHSASS